MRVAVVTILLIGMSLVGMPLANAQTEGLDYSEDTVFTVVDGTVRVDIIATMANTTVERREGNAIIYSFFDELLVVAPIGAQNVSVTSRGSSLSSTTSPIDDDFELLTFALPSELRSGESRTFSISYELPTGELRGDGLFFVNPAQSAFPLWSFSDPGRGSLQVRIPADAELNDIGQLLRRTGSDDGFVSFAPIDFSLPSELFAYVTVTNEAELETRSISVSGQNIEINSWPGDEVWADFAEETISLGLPVFEEVIGLSVPEQETLQVTESVTPYFFGYGGWYNSLDTSIDIGNELDDTVMLHELSHAWFNIDLFTERWISEGLAEEFTWRVQGELGLEQEIPPAQPRLTDRGAQPLERWNSALAGTTNSEIFRNQEEYGYETSWFIVREITNTIGLEDMQAVLRDAAQDAPSYPTEQLGVDRDGSAIENDWRRLLDLASLHATPEEAEQIEELFVDYVIDIGRLDDFAERTAARIEYEILVQRTPRWAVSEDIASAMGSWDFERADVLLDTARLVQNEYQELEDGLEGTDLVVSDSARVAYEQGGSAVEDALVLIQRQAAAVDRIVAMEADVDAGRTFRQRLGLLGGSAIPDFVEEAKLLLAEDDFVGVEMAASELDAALLDAERSGALRMAIIFALLAVLLMAIGVIGWRRSKPPTTPIEPLEATPVEESDLAQQVAEKDLPSMESDVAA